MNYINISEFDSSLWVLNQCSMNCYLTWTILNNNGFKTNLSWLMTTPYLFFLFLFFHLKRSTRKFCSLTNITTFHHCFAHVYVYLSDIDWLLLLLKKGRNIGVNAFQSYSFGASCRYEWRYKIKKNTIENFIPDENL